MDKVNLDEAFASFDATWDPRIVGRVNDYDVKIVHVSGEFTEHVHPDADEFFHVLAGELAIELDDGPRVVLAAGEIYTVPAGIRHRPVAVPGTRILLFEPRGTDNRGDVGGGTTGTPLA